MKHIKSDRQKQIDRLDALYRELIRRRAMLRVGGCERCLAPKISYKQLDTAHLFGRGQTVRWDPRASAGLCGGCHRYIDTKDQEAKRQLGIKLLGEDYERLYVLAHMTSKQSAIDLTLTEIYLKTLLKEVNGR